MNEWVSHQESGYRGQVRKTSIEPETFLQPQLSPSGGLRIECWFKAGFILRPESYSSCLCKETEHMHQCYMVIGFLRGREGPSTSLAFPKVSCAFLLGILWPQNISDASALACPRGKNKINILNLACVVCIKPEVANQWVVVSQGDFLSRVWWHLGR